MGLSEFGVIINSNFSVNAEKFVLGVSSPRVNFELNAIQIYKHLVEVLQLFNGIFADVIEFKNIDYLLSDLGGKSFLGLNGENVDVFFVDFFDFDSSILGTDDCGSL